MAQVLQASVLQDSVHAMHWRHAQRHVLLTCAASCWPRCCITIWYSWSPPPEACSCSSSRS